MEECQRMPTPMDIISRMPKEELTESEPYTIALAKCGLCKHDGMAIKEEPYLSVWRCRQCYTGLTSEQHKAKWMELQRIISRNEAQEAF